MQDPNFQKWASGRGLKTGEASDTYANWLANFRITPERLTFLTDFVLKETSYYMDECYVHGVWLFDESSIRTCPDASNALRENLLLIGGCANGDYLALDLNPSPHEIGFVSHEKLWRANPPPVRDCFLSLRLDFTGYLALDNQGVRISDFCDAESYLRKQS